MKTQKQIENKLKQINTKLCSAKNKNRLNRGLALICATALEWVLDKKD